ncbi:MAG: hypothetical protein ACYS22_07665, partial [Planctomycetota bacterium]
MVKWIKKFAEQADALLPAGVTGTILRYLFLAGVAVGLLLAVWKVFQANRDRLASLPGVGRLFRRRAGSALTSSTLVRVWRRFLAQIPREFRRLVSKYKPFIVLGAAGSGKTKVISRYTDWQGQSAKFYSSYSTEKELQIYLGSREIVQEIPSSVLDDISQTARRALHKLWVKTTKETEPIVVIALSAGGLRSLTPDALKRQAQVLRGKLNILSRIRKGPIRVRIVLTHMEKVDGYLAFSQFLDKQRIPLKADLREGPGKDDLSACLTPYEEYLPLALTHLSNKAYRKVLAFLSDAPSLFAYVNILLKTLSESEPLSFEPEVTSIFFTSEMESQTTTPAGSPFSTHGETLQVDRSSRMRNHKIAASLIGLAGLGVVLGGFGYDWAQYRRAELEGTSFKAD